MNDDKKLTAELRLGGFHELPDGRITRSAGWNGINKTVYHYFDDDSGRHETAFAEVSTWKYRDDLGDYPNARDPRLPYRFDLFWDLKNVSELKAAIESGCHYDIDEIVKAAEEEGYDFTPPAPTAASPKF